MKVNPVSQVITLLHDLHNKALADVEWRTHSKLIQNGMKRRPRHEPPGEVIGNTYKGRPSRFGTSLALSLGHAGSGVEAADTQQRVRDSDSVHRQRLFSRLSPWCKSPCQRFKKTTCPGSSLTPGQQSLHARCRWPYRLRQVVWQSSA